MSDCGPGAGDCCCESPLVTGGTFYRTYDLAGRAQQPALAADGGPTNEADPATVSGLRLDKYLVTVGRFRPFVDAWRGGWRPTPGSGKHDHLNSGQGLANAGDAGVEYETGWLATDDDNIAPTDANLGCFPGYDTWTSTAGSHETLPLNCVSWYDAYAFCIWDGGFLPSEAESEYAAAGGGEQREYPWGSTPPGTASAYAIYGCNYPPGDAGPYFGPDGCSTAPVGWASQGSGRWGQLDLTGNVSEWNLDWTVSHWVDPCVDCANLTEPPPSMNEGRMAQGADFTYLLYALSVAESLVGNGGLPAGRYYGLGFRCARAP